jgi:FkbM family methyltransferase
MSTKYFLLSKQEEKNISNNEENQIIFLNKKNIYILPHVNINYYLTNGLFESNLIDWCKQFCDLNKNILDIGAHTGTYSISLSKFCNHIYSFEPQKMTYYALCGGVALSNINNITCYNFGLGSETQVGNQNLKIISNDGGGSSLHIDNKNNIICEETIKIEILDNINLENISFIKMDVEGNEYDVILGGIKTIKNSNYPKILFESNNNNNNNNNDKNKNTNLFKILEEIGYKIINISGYSNMFLAFT